MTDGRHWVLDRIEDGRQAVLVSADGKTERVVSLAELPPGVREGDAVQEHAGDGSGEDREDRSKELRYEIDREAAERLRREADEMRASLRRGPSGPVSL